MASSSSGGLNDVIDKNELIDIKFSGNPYTWSNGREGLANIKERLNRAFTNERWRIKLCLPKYNHNRIKILVFHTTYDIICCHLFLQRRKFVYFILYFQNQEWIFEVE